MEIERKFLIKQIPEGCTSFPCRQIEQAYLNTDPVVRVRRDNDDYYLTYKGKGLLSREEYNLPLNKEAYEHLLAKADGIILAEVEFASEEEAKAFNPPAWFGEDVTFSGEYHNSRLSKG